ncbi:mandelate racemase/muconate lactonizing enzyme family protein [Thermodesulfobacteriota bacterium]
MIITEVRLTPKVLPYKGEGWRISTGPIKESRMVFVEIITDKGIIGQGCTSSGPPFISGESQESIVSIVENVFSKQLIGKSPYDVEQIMAQLDKAAYMNYRAKAGVDMALFDLIGKSLGVPVQNILGSSQRKNIPVMRLIGLKEPDDMAADAQTLVDQGYKALKIKIGENKPVDIKRVEAIRSKIPGDIALTLDLNCAYRPKEAIELMNELTQFNISLVEQPVNRDDIEGLAFVRENTRIPIEVDESVITLADAARIARLGAADFISVKLLKMGGIHKAKKIAAVCEAFGIGCVLGTTPGSQLIDIASAHFFLSTANIWWAAEIGEFIRMQDDPVSGLELKEGCLEIPEGPGFGVSIRY